MPYCDTKTKLLDDAQGILASLIDVVARQREAVKNDDRKSVAALDVQLERLFGEKERTLGALYQHTQEHGCQAHARQAEFLSCSGGWLRVPIWREEMSESTSPVAMISALGEGRPVHVLGADLAIKISSRDTNGAFAVFEGHTPPLEGPPLHRHRDHDEWWYIVKGEYRFEVDGKEIYASEGATVFAPRGSCHTFQNVGTEPGWTITTVVPGGVDLFFEDVEAVAPRGTELVPAKLLGVFERYHQEMLGPPMRLRVDTSAEGAD